MLPEQTTKYYKSSVQGYSKRSLSYTSLNKNVNKNLKLRSLQVLFFILGLPSCVHVSFSKLQVKIFFTYLK